MRTIAVSLVALALLAAPVVAQEPVTDRSPAALTGRDDTILTLYGQQGLGGPAYSYSRTTGNIGSMQRIESLRTSGGAWEVCDRHGFQGECRIVEGRYQTLSQVGLRQIRSIRPVVPAPGA